MPGPLDDQRFPDPMNASMTRGSLTLVSAAVLALLTACGGGSSNDPAASLAAKDDAASVPWNAATPIDVAANDTPAGGNPPLTPALTIATAPAHGTATVDGTKILYTPAGGFFGQDTLTYQLAAGDRASTASVHIAVEAHLTLTGNVHDDALPGAEVVATVGGAAQAPVTADADGNYEIEFVTSDPHAFITLRATGSGAQSNVVLSSLVGDASDAAAAAQAGGTDAGLVEAHTLPAVNVTNITTAAAVLAAQALGKAPASNADLAAAQGKFTPAQIVQMAAAIKLVADQGVALPDGAASTLALVTDPVAYAAFVSAQAATNTDAFQQAQAAVMSDPAVAAPPPLPGFFGPDVEYVVTLGEGAAETQAYRITLRADGTARVVGSAARTGIWSTDDDHSVTIRYDEAISYDTLSNPADSPDMNQYDIRQMETGLKLRQLGGTSASGPVTITTINSYQWLDGPQAGLFVDLPDSWQAETMIASTQAFASSDFTAGSEWAGVLASDSTGGTDGLINQDTLKIVDGQSVVFERAGTQGTYAIVDGSLVVTTADGVIRYSRMFPGPKGEARWLAERIVDGTPAWAYDAAVVKAGQAQSFTASSLVHKWLSYINVGLADGQFYVSMRQDGTGSQVSVDPVAGQSEQPAGTWSIAADGTETLTLSRCDDGTLSCGNFKTRTWKLLGTSGKNIYVMEYLALTDGGVANGQYRVNVYTNAD
jgi:hypothetical protein